MMPRYEDLDWKGLDFSVDEFENLMAVDKAPGLNEALSVVQYFKQFKKHLPPEFMNEVALLFLRLVRSDVRWTLPRAQEVKAKKPVGKKASAKTGKKAVAKTTKKAANKKK